MNGYWRALGTWSPSSWSLPLAVEYAGTVVGVQSLEAENFSALRTVDSGSWLVPAVRGRGVGVAMRMAALGLAFDHLGALAAITSARRDNGATREREMPRRAAPVDPSIGDRIQSRRELRGWSIRHAASRAGIAHTTWSRIEKGELRSDRYMVADIAATLECSITDLTGQPYTPADRQLETAHIAAERLWQAMMALPMDEPPAAGARVVMDLGRESELIRDLYARTDYGGALSRLVDLLPMLHTAAHGP